MKTEDIRDLLMKKGEGNGFIPINKNLIKRVGLEAAVIYGELVTRQCYFENQNRLTGDEFFYNTVADIEEVTTLSAHKQRNAINKLIELGLLKVSYRPTNINVSPTRHFKIIKDIELIEECLKPIENTKALKNLTFEGEKIKHSKVKKFNANNNNLNNNHLITKKIKGVFSSEQYSCRLSLNNFEEEYIEAIQYYLERYYQKTGNYHPVFNEEYWFNIVDNMFWSYDGFGDKEDQDLDYDDLINMIDKHFKTTYKNGCDYNMAHFMSEGVQFRRMFEVAY